MGGNRSRKSENWKKVVTMQPKIGSRKTGPEIGKRKCGYNERFFDFRTRFSENVVTMSDFWLRFSENRKFFPIEFFDRIFLSDSDFLRCVKGGPDRSFSDKKFFSKNDLTTPNFMRGIDCAHSRIVKMLS